jgi:hypothetical protein
MALGVDGGGMKIKIQITIESDEGKPEALQEVAQLNRGSLRPESLGLTLAEARSILAGIEQTVVERQAAEFVAQQRLCSACGQEGVTTPKGNNCTLSRLGRVLINSVHVRFTPKATQLLRSSGMSRSAGTGYSNT